MFTDPSVAWRSVLCTRDLQKGLDRTVHYFNSMMRAVVISDAKVPDYDINGAVLAGRVA